MPLSIICTRALGTALGICLVFRYTTAFRYLYRPFLFVVFLRFLIVLSVLANGLVDRVFLAKEAEQNLAALEVYPSRIESLNTEAVLTPEARSAMRADLETLNATVDQLMLARDDALTLKLAREDEIEKLESLRDTRYQEIGVVQRFNPLRDDVALEQLGVDLREARLQLAKQSELIADTNTQIERHQREIEVIENTLQGAPLGILQSIVQNTRKLGSGILSGGLIDVFRSMMDSLVELVSEVVPILLNLIALFVLQTMVFPLLFLYAFLRGFKAIWGISMADLARRGWQDIRQATQPTQP